MIQQLKVHALLALTCVAGPALADAPGDESPAPAFQLIVHVSNPVDTLTREEVAAFFLLADADWASGARVEPVHQAAGSPIRAAFEQAVHGKSAAAVAQHWEKRAVQGRSTPAPELDGDDAVMDWVRSREGAIGYVSPNAFRRSGVKRIMMTSDAGDDDDDDEEEAEEDEKPSRVSLVLDASGSMSGAIDGRSKFDIARDVILGLLDEWDMEVELGLTVYGHREGTCQDIETLVPVGRPNPRAVAAALGNVRPRGSTPLTQAVLVAAENLAKTGDGEAQVVLVSDGQETCSMDPCSLAAETAEKGIAFTAYVVGFDILRDAGAQAQLRCLADRSGGTFELAWDARSLEKALNVALARATGKLPPEEDAPIVAEEEQDGPPVLDMKLLFVRAGEVSPAADSGSGRRPRRRVVEVPYDFWIADSEVTQGDWRTVMGNNPSYDLECGDGCPVQRVNYFDALAFANRLSELHGFEPCYQLSGCRGIPGSGCRSDGSCEDGYFCSQVIFQGVERCEGYRLPTADEWELAARSFSQEPFSWGGEMSPGLASCGSSFARMEPVRSYPPNDFGLYDMHGNLWEWTSPGARQRRQYAPKDEDTAAAKLESRERRSTATEEEWVAGGSWQSPASQCRADSRHELAVAYRHASVGLRLARTDL